MRSAIHSHRPLPFVRNFHGVRVSACDYWSLFGNDMYVWSVSAGTHTRTGRTKTERTPTNYPFTSLPPRTVDPLGPCRASPNDPTGERNTYTLHCVVQDVVPRVGWTDVRGRCRRRRCSSLPGSG